MCPSEINLGSRSPSRLGLSVFSSLMALSVLAFAGCGRSGLLDQFTHGSTDGGCVGPGCAQIPDLFGADGFVGPGDGDGGPTLDHDMFPDGPPPNLDGPGCAMNVEICNDGIDDNCNGLIDCADPSCAADAHCTPPGAEICNNGIDDDGNGFIDCADAACKTFPGCQPNHMCDLNKVDCADPACITQPQCQNVVCKPTVSFGTLQPHDSSSHQSLSTLGTKDVTITQCAQGGGGMVVTDFVLAGVETAAVRLDYAQSVGSDHTFALFRSGIGQACNANPIDCFDPKAALTGGKVYVLSPGHYYLIVQAFTSGHQGTLDVTLSTASNKVKEICNNGVDDDKNGLIDCADPACFADVSCIGKECMPNLVLGALVANINPQGKPQNQLIGKSGTASTRGKSSAYNLSCGGTGGAFAIEVTLKETAGMAINFDEQGSDQVISLFALPPPGQACDAHEFDKECFLNPQPRFPVELAFNDIYPPGDYLIIFKALTPKSEGPIDFFVYAYKNAKPIELCHNNIDDDNNGFIDCLDPACVNDPKCPAPACSPDVEFGPLKLGQSMSTVLDLTNGVQHLIASCAVGGGKSRVIQFELPQVSGLGISCSDNGGESVVDLLYPGGPRDSCDKNELSCADPNTIPFGCNFEWPNLQPGTYYLMAQAFKAGQEGKVNVTLSAIADRALEICNNGIDDDKDGFIDCADKKCALSPYCAPKACVPDATVDPMPLDASMLVENLSTLKKMPAAQPSCEVKTGGGTAVVLVNLPAQANLTVGYLQGFGKTNHVIALYPDAGMGLICDAGKELGCVATKGAANGSAVFNKVPAGKYYIIVAADSPGDEGPIFLDLSASP